jgi:hypothetical protein
VPAVRTLDRHNSAQDLPIDKKDYKAALDALQIQLVKLQRHVIADGLRVLVVLEGRDAAGKDGVIKRIVEHLNPRDTRVVALGIPSDREQRSWYYQRWRQAKSRCSTAPGTTVPGSSVSWGLPPKTSNACSWKLFLILSGLSCMAAFR